jgi:hypothetical protein
MENSPENPLRLSAISFEAPDVLKISKPHDPIPKSDKYYFWGDNRISTSLKINRANGPITKKVDAATYKDEAAINALLDGKSIFLYYVDDWDEQNNSISFYAM